MSPHYQLHTDLLNWYRHNHRELPWRENSSPYRVWLSEIILQQTRVDQGLPYYLKFVDHYPTVRHLAEADLDLVLKDWQGLGYYSRARNMHQCAQVVMDQFNGEFPKSASELAKLPGIGPYTASAIASICFQEPTAVVDGNVFRVVARLTNSNIPINSTEGKRYFATEAHHLLNPVDPGTHNQAMMELGALVCTPRNPSCPVCPLRLYCDGLKNNRVDELPVKMGKSVRRTRYFNYLVVQTDCLFIRQRLDRDVWFMLHDFPLVETEEKVNNWSEVISLFQTKYDLDLGNDTNLLDPVHEKHILSHQTIQATFWRLQPKSIRFGADSNIFEADLEDIEERYAVPILIKNYLSNLNAK
ncbi:MAG: A/G-specific adenine glycosylase [Flavobacteriales bacterium]|nr:A/G-specific adenine glycosylase [Bacteroidota bacterium]MCB9239950.1 A/G-specific adenine glycosylase [Flavobacteriales bacterium]